MNKGVHVARFEAQERRRHALAHASVLKVLCQGLVGFAVAERLRIELLVVLASCPVNQRSLAGLELQVLCGLLTHAMDLVKVFRAILISHSPRFPAELGLAGGRKVDFADVV